MTGKTRRPIDDGPSYYFLLFVKNYLLVTELMSWQQRALEVVAGCHNCEFTGLLQAH